MACKVFMIINKISQMMMLSIANSFLEILKQLIICDVAKAVKDKATEEKIKVITKGMNKCLSFLILVKTRVFKFIIYSPNCFNMR
jgi:hypothetical protein